MPASTLSKRLATTTDRVPSLYVYKCRNDPNTEFNAYGDWEEVFDASGPVRWGGAWATRNPTSIRIFEDELEVGDLILAWQTDRRAAIGVAEVVGFLTADREVQGELIVNAEHIVLEAREEFPKPVRLHELKRTTMPKLAEVPALKQANVATIYRTTPQHAHLLLKACGSRFAADFKG
jgi:hypothetical protein